MEFGKGRTWVIFDDSLKEEFYLVDVKLYTNPHVMYKTPY
jgi:hypothetical protein